MNFLRKSFNQKIKKLSSSFIVVLLVCMNFLIHLPYKAEAATTELKGLGDVSYYNAIIFGDHSATSADIEGAMAVQKNMNASSYTVVAAATGANNLAGATWVDEGYPSLLLGGQFTKAGAGQVIIQDGTVAMTKDGDPDGAMKTSYDRISYKEQAEIDAKFKEFRKDVSSVIEDAGQLHTDKPKPGMTFGIGEDVNNPNIYVSSGLEGQEPFNVKDVYLPNVNNKDFIVIHSDAEEVNFGGGAILYDTTDKGGFTLVNTSQAYDPNSFFTELASKVIWVFPNAKKITTKGYGVVGSVFAPNAVVETKGGSINGQAFVGGLHQRDGFEVHNFKFNWPKWKKPAAEKGNLQIKKVDENDENIVLKDAKFDVIDKDNNVVATVTTNEKGIAEVKDLPFGDYFVKEISAPEGYIKVDTPVKVTIDNTNVIELVMKNTRKVENGQFKLLKKDSESGQLLPGAKFDVIDKDGKVVETIVTDDKGEALSKQLPVGSYTLKEVEAPKGYELSSSSVSVDVEANKVVTVDVVNKKIPEKVTGQFEIVKVDAEDKTKVLSDAEFEVYKGGKKVETLRTDKTGKVISQKLEPGTYTLKETKAPQGYKLLKEEIEVVVEANKVVEVQVENAKELGSLQVIKKDAESGKVLEGAEFRLKNENGQVVGETKTTNKDGVVKFENLVPGKYTLEETKAPEGYKAVEVTVEVNVVANEVVKQEVMNEKLTGQFEIVKVDAEDKAKVLSDAEFEVYKGGKKVETLRTDKTGKVISQKLEPGTYTLKETKAPQGYKLLKEEIEVVVEANKVVQVQVENAKELGSLQVIKKDAESGKVLEGAEFKLKNEAGQVVGETKTTNKDGVVKFENLVPGKYTLEETKAPEGYKAVEVTVEVSVVANEVVKQEVMNEKLTGQFEIVKVDAEDKAKVLSDAEFEVYKGGKKVETLRTDKTGKVISQKLEPGTYTLKETKAPQGYKLLKEEIEVVVEANKVVQVQVENAKELGSLQVIKKDAESGKVLEGAEFKLKNEAGQVVGETKTTNKDGVVKFENLVPGKYTLEETKAPEGYKAVEVTVEVNVVANEVVKQEVTNEKVTGQFEIVKVDANDKTKLLSGAEFEVYKDGKKVAELKTDESGKVMSPKLPLGEYTVKETKAPEGYKLSNKEWKVTIQNENEIVKLEAENEKILGSLQIIKTDDKDQTKRLAGAEFTLKDVKGNVVKEGITTDKSGTVKVDGLVPGEYTLEETKAPEGYELTKQVIHVTVDGEKIVDVKVANSKSLGQFEIVKVDAEDKAKVLSDAEFEVYKDGKKVETLRTDKTGKVISQKLEPGKYTLKETKAPQGYTLLKEEIEVVVEANKVVQVQVENAKELGSLQVIKKDAESGKVLEGAEFKLKNEAGQVVGETKTTNKDGIVKFENLVPGKYTLEETKAPEGYKVLEVTVEVNVVANEVVKQEVKNEKVTGQFEIVKVDAEDKAKVLSDAEFEVYKDGKKVETLRTDKTGKVISQKLEPGTYTLKETKAPQGYKLLKEEIEVVVEANKVVQVQVENAKELGSLQVIKKDAESGKVLEGAEFKLKNEAGQVVGETKTTNKDGVVKFENLVPGKYMLEETKAPEGYKVLEVTVEVNVVANEVVKQEVLNEKVKEEITGQLEITKVDANDTNKTLAGAVFEIWKDGTKIDTLTSDANGKATSKELDPGDYILKEVQAPEGYELSDKEIEFTISNQKFEVVKLQITNKKETSKGPEKPGEETEKPGEETEKPGEETEKPGEETEKPGEETEKPGEEIEKPGGETEKPGEETEKPGGETEKPGEGMGNPDKEKGQGTSHAQQLPATGHDMNYLPFIGFALVLLGIRLRFMIKNN
ncbi:SpaA isopeptide-forming pilin-related protein [Bacillus tropicus]|uniref:SpaA isopeptide-forming pilin-related protein n=2 Tax=Bacillus tropicus TaxID=2026188 RepID=UPI0011BCF561|nr:SpaA isopeptide-forming pilin-related protein [Bacillus tropicus]